MEREKARELLFGGDEEEESMFVCCVVFDEREREIMGFELQLESLETAIL